MKRLLLIRRLLLLGGMVISAAGLHAQTQRVDSLKQVVAQTGEEGHKIDILFELCAERNALHPDTLLKYANLARGIALRRNDRIGATLAQYYITLNLLTRGQTDSSLKIADSALRSLSYSGAGHEAYIDFILLKARAFNNQNRPKESLDLLYPLLTEAERLDDTATQITAINGMVGAYVSLNDNRKALDWGYRALPLFPVQPSLAVARSMGITLSNLSLCYIHLYQSDSVKVYLDSADLFTRRVIAQDGKYGFLSAYDLGLQGVIDGFAHRTAQGEAALLKSLALYRSVGNAYYIINTMSVLGDFYHTSGQPAKGIAICKEGISLQGTMKPNFYLYENLAENYQLAGMYKEYGETMNRLLSLKDSMYKVNSAEALSGLRARYDVQTRENIIIRQKLDLTRKNNLLYGSLGLLVLILVIGYIVLTIRKKNRTMRLQQWQVEEKKKTLQAVLQAEENERVRIAADLHDGVAQKMVVAKMNLQTLETYLPALDGEQRRVFDNISSLVEESCTEVRDLSHSMMPQAFFRSGLTEAVSNLLNKIGDRRLLVKFNAEGDLGHVPEQVQVMIYRIMQECIQNVLKHAQADTLDISIIAEEEALDITIEDDGVGFDTGASQAGVGLANIRSRIAFLNGEMDISSRPGAGTLIAIHIPLKNLTP